MLRFQHDGRGRFAAVVDRDVSRRMEWTLRASWSPGLTLMDVFLWRHLKEHVYTASPRTIEDLVAEPKQL
jgi:hypothetical protein